MGRYYQNKAIDLKDGIIEDIQTVLSGLLSEDARTISYLNDWGDYLVFCSNAAAANGNCIQLCEKAADWYYKRMGSSKLDYYFLELNPLAVYFQSVGRSDSAIVINDKAKKLALEYNNTPVLAETYYAQGTYLYAQNDLAGASDCWDKSLDNFNNMPEKSTYVDYVNVLNGLTLIYFTIGNYSKSLSYAKQYTQACINKYGNQSAAYAAALCLLAKDQYNLQETDSAIINLKQAVKICEDNPSINSDLKSNISLTY